MSDTAIEATTDTPPLIEQILDWSEKSLPPWQQDALRRLFHQTAAGLDDTDYDELYAMLQKHNGVTDGSAPTPLPLLRSEVSSLSASREHATLLSMHSLEHVNKIVAGARLEFAEVGLTVIYGGNGSGKSGFARVLKRACRARDQSEAIHPDATNATHAGKRPAASFDIRIGDKQETIAWTASGASPDELATVAVFDSRCARAYLTTEGDIAYIPYGLDLVADLANRVLPRLEVKLTTELNGIPDDASATIALQGATRVGELIAQLSKDTKDAEVVALATLTEAEIARLAELDGILKSADPAKEAKKLELEATRLENLCSRIDVVSSAVDLQAIAKLRGIADAYAVADDAAKLAASTLRSGETVLPGTGEEVWKAMFNAARKFSEEEAYPAHVFPHVADDAVCPLCQQHLEQDGISRLQRFDEYLKTDTAKSVASAKMTLEKATRAFGQQSLELQIDAALTTELDALEVGLSQLVTTFQTATISRRQAMIEAVGTRDWRALDAELTTPRERVHAHAASVRMRAAALTASSVASHRAQLDAECTELRARQALNASLATVTSRLRTIKRRANLEACRKDLQTRTISAKAKTLSDQVVTTALREALTNELTGLGTVHLDMTFSNRTDKGKSKYKLQASTTSAIKLDEILSEGEQRAIAIAAFLAELGMSGHKGGIVFDDPVSSLDHERKRRIADRFASEARKRQVVIFTHDLPFFGMLMESAERMGAGVHRPTSCMVCFGQLIPPQSL